MSIDSSLPLAPAVLIDAALPVRNSAAAWSTHALRKQYKAGSLVYDKSGDYPGTGVLLEDTVGYMQYGKVKFGGEVIEVQLADKEHCGWVGFHGIPGAPAVKLLS
jgi:hypothetical protein